jgi:lambda repressor-like predicted transcriptional regulator
MKPNEIKAELIKFNITGAEIAKKAGCSKQYVSAIIHRSRTNSAIELIIAEAVGKPIDEVFPPTKQEESAKHLPCNKKPRPLPSTIKK